MNYEICNSCKINKAVWDYMPGFSSGKSSYFCDDCVHRGCSCNHRYINEEYPNDPEGDEGKDWVWVEKDVSWTYIDDKGREYPCGEYDYDPDGYEREINPHMYETE